MRTQLQKLLGRSRVWQTWKWSHRTSFTFRQSRAGSTILADNGDNNFENGMEGGYVAEMDGTSGREPEMIPWVRSIVNGIEIIRNPQFNKGMAFSEEEREKLYLRGLLPPKVMPMNTQMKRVMTRLESLREPLEQYVHLMGLQERNERLFYRVLSDEIEQLLPIVYTPTVSRACAQYGLIYSRPRGLYITIQDRGKVYGILKNWPGRNVKTAVITDGACVLGAGDLGIQGMGLAVGKAALYAACGGINPAYTLPIALDVGTDNDELLGDSFYIGIRRHRVDKDMEEELVDEVMWSLKRRFGESILIQFEGMSKYTAMSIVQQYRGTHTCFNDDIQGTAATTLAGIFAAQRVTGEKFSDKTFLFVGGNTTVVGIADLLAFAISKAKGILLHEAREQIWIYDSEGLVVRNRLDSLDPFLMPYAHDGAVCESLLDAIKINSRPLIFALSNRPEVACQDAYEWTQGRCLYSAATPLDKVVTSSETVHYPKQFQTAYIFPGIALGVSIARATRIRDEMFLAAADAVATQVTDEELEKGSLYPSLKIIRKIAAHVARAVASQSYELDVAGAKPKPVNLLDTALSSMYNPKYRRYR